MRIELKEITVRDLVEGYEDKQEEGVVAYSQKLDVRPPYQREFIYKDKQREAVIDTITQDFPLNVMYWAVRDDGTFEVIDGQQRTISICQYINGDFPFETKFFNNLEKDEQEQILNYKLMVYFCEGNDSEKLKWFETINIAGEQLTKQELRNAVYSGVWVTDAKKKFSKNSCPAYAIGGDYLNGSAIRQDYLETAIKWISNSKKDDDIRLYMAEHQHDANALALWQYFQSVITWVEGTFPKKRKKFMKGLDWGTLYNEFKNKVLDAKALEEEITRLIADDDVVNKKGIYFYVLTKNEKYLNIRTFTDSQKQKAYEEQKGICKTCKGHFELEQMEGDHITPWHEGGKTTEENLQMLCKDCNRRKSGK